jgi:hypothetical protein
VITLDHDQAGSGAMVVRLSAACDLAGATEVTSEQSGARRYLRLDRNSTEFSATRAYTFPGGCVTQRFRGAGPSAFRLSDTASTEFGFITREEQRRRPPRRPRDTRLAGLTRACFPPACIGPAVVPIRRPEADR